MSVFEGSLLTILAITKYVPYLQQIDKHNLLSTFAIAEKVLGKIILLPNVALKTARRSKVAKSYIKYI